MSKIANFTVEQIIKTSFGCGITLSDGRDLVYQTTDIEFLKWVKSKSPHLKIGPWRPIFTAYDRYELLQKLKNSHVFLGVTDVDSYTEFIERMEWVEEKILKDIDEEHRTYPTIDDIEN